MMLKKTVWAAMANAFENAHGDLAERMLTALEAAQSEGGDIRGKQSAAMLVVSDDPDDTLNGKVVDLRVDDHPEPLHELRRLFTLQRAYQLMNEGDELLGRGKSLQSFEAYQKAVDLAPHVEELPFWQAITMLDSGRIEESLPIFKRLFASSPDWMLLLERLPKAGLLKDDPALIQRIKGLMD